MPIEGGTDIALTAWNFHQTAYKDRIDEVQKALVVIEKLQQYRPKNYKRKHGTQTPIATGYTFGTPMTEKEHARKLNNALRSALKNASRPATPAIPDGHDDAARKRLSRSYFAPSPGPSKPGTPADEIKDPFSTNRSSPQREDMEEIPLQPIQPSSRPQTRTGERAPSPHRLSFQPNQFQPQHRYTTSALSYPESVRGNGHPQRPPLPRRQTDGGEAIKTAAKAIGKAVLHDARNLQGKQEVLLSWDVSSSYEAKVCIFSFLSVQLPKPSCSVLHDQSSAVSGTSIANTSSHQTSTLLSLLAKRPSRHSNFSTRMVTEICPEERSKRSL